MKGTLAKLVIFIAALSMTGCRVGVAVFEGGDVISASGERHCFEGGTCEFEVSDTDFTESFTAQPRSGFEFVRWRGGSGYLCAGSTDPTCIVSNEWAEGEADAEAVIATTKMFYLMPEFECVIEYCPLRPDPNWRALDEALVAMEEAKNAIAAYVINNNGHGAVSAVDYGIHLGTRNSNMLHRLVITPNDASGSNLTFYITAEIYKTVWEGGDSYFSERAAFSLSGSTNADNSISWQCIPAGAPNSSYPATIPVPYLPLNCRG